MRRQKNDWILPNCYKQHVPAVPWRKRSDINVSTFQKVNTLYPADKATGYKENEIRGLWVVEMLKKKN